MPTRFCRALAGGVMVAQGSLEPLVMVRIHAGQPFRRTLQLLKPRCRRLDGRLKSQHSRRAHLPSKYRITARDVQVVEVWSTKANIGQPALLRLRNNGDHPPGLVTNLNAE